MSSSSPQPESTTTKATSDNKNNNSNQKLFVVDPFCYRQFREYYNKKNIKDIDYTGTIFDISISEFERIVNERYKSDSTIQLKDGYATFCKHLFLHNDFTNATVNILPITNENEHLLRSKYLARNEYELPVLIRYFPKELIIQHYNNNKNNTTTSSSSSTDNMLSSILPIAKYLDIILYSREQINLENQARDTNKDDQTSDDATTTTTTDNEIPWGIVSIKAQDINYEIPMTPITNMRNALGKEYGGSGIPINKDQYMECIHYWKDHATIS